MARIKRIARLSIEHSPADSAKACGRGEHSAGDSQFSGVEQRVGNIAPRFFLRPEAGISRDSGIFFVSFQARGPKFYACLQRKTRPLAGHEAVPPYPTSHVSKEI